MARSGDLDVDFGTAVVPRYIDQHEIDHISLSLVRLDAENAQILKNLMGLAVHHHHIVSMPFRWLYFLWLISEEGDFLFAYEEMLALATPNARAARQVGAAIPIGQVRLGHPSMVGGAPARIGGELLYDYRDGVWILSNRSGRYGVGRVKNQLENVQELLTDFGVKVGTHFVEREW